MDIQQDSNAVGKNAAENVGSGMRELEEASLKPDAEAQELEVENRGASGLPPHAASPEASKKTGGTGAQRGALGLVAGLVAGLGNGWRAASPAFRIGVLAVGGACAGWLLRNKWRTLRSARLSLAASGESSSIPGATRGSAGAAGDVGTPGAGEPAAEPGETGAGSTGVEGWKQDLSAPIRGWRGRIYGRIRARKPGAFPGWVFFRTARSEPGRTSGQP